MWVLFCVLDVTVCVCVRACVGERVAIDPLVTKTRKAAGSSEIVLDLDKCATSPAPTMNWLMACTLDCVIYSLFSSLTYNARSLLSLISLPPVQCSLPLLATLPFPHLSPPEGRLGMSDVSPLSGISGLSFDSTLLSPLLFFCLVLLPFLSYRFLPAGPFF